MRALLLVLLLTTPAHAETVVDVTLGEAQARIYDATERFVDAEGAFRSAKTWTVLIKIRLQLEEYPGKQDAQGRFIPGSGIRWTIARWTEDDLHQKLIPDYRSVCALLGLHYGEWNPKEQCFEFPQGQRIYAVHLKSSQTSSRYAKVRGLTTAGFYIDQLEEIPEDVYNEAALRLSQPGFPQQMIVTPNPVSDSHWIARRFRPIEKNPLPDHRLLTLSIWDNAHNLSPETIRAAETLYPVGHPARPTKLEGRRGLDVRGLPVYSGAFVRSRHVPDTGVARNAQLPLYESYDYGFHHPCVVFYQWAPWGWLGILGGVMGQDMHLDEFLPIVERYRLKWFGDVDLIDATCDPAGANENAQGIKGKPVSILREWYREHRTGKHEVVPRYISAANMPENRRTAIDRGATYMRHQGMGGAECFAVDRERWVLVSKDEIGNLDERWDGFFLDGLELGYVLESDDAESILKPKARHSSRLGTYYVPVKDGWFEHAQNCFEYGLQMHVHDLPQASARAPEVHRQFLIDVERAAKIARQQALVEAQLDIDEDPFGDKVDGLVPATPMRHHGGRSGY